MDNAAKVLAYKIISELQSIKRLIVDAISNPQKKHADAQGNQRQSHGGAREAAPRIDAPPSATQPSATCKHDADDKNNFRFPRLAKWKPIIDLFGLIVLTAYTTITAFQWYAVLRSNKISQDQLTASTRPWVALDGMPKVITPLSFDAEGLAHFELSVAYKNAGNSPSLGTALITNLVFEPGNSTLFSIREDLATSLRTAALYKCDVGFANFMDRNDSGRLMLPQVSEEVRLQFPNAFVAPVRPGGIVPLDSLQSLLGVFRIEINSGTGMGLASPHITK